MNQMEEKSHQHADHGKEQQIEHMEFVQPLGLGGPPGKIEHHQHACQRQEHIGGEGFAEKCKVWDHKKSPVGKIGPGEPRGQSRITCCRLLPEHPPRR